MVWILLLVHITLHGMIGGLLKHFPKAVCGIIFICKEKKQQQKKPHTLLNVKKRKLFFIAVSMHLSQSRTPRAQVQFKLREGDVFFLFFSYSFCLFVWSRDGRARCLFLSLALIRKCSQHGIARVLYTQRCNLSSPL